MIDSKGRTLLLRHKRLGRWMPPGGHVDPDESPADAARRECKEETGLDVEIVGDPQPDLFADNAHEGRMMTKPIAMLLENIPASEERGEPAHEHMDFLYVAKPKDESQILKLAADEGADIRWFTKKEIEELPAGDIFANVRTYVTKYL